MAYYNHLRILLLLCYICVATGAFTLPTNNAQNYVQQNAQKTWCYYPAVAQTRDGSCTGDFTMVSRVHLNTTISIGYYAPDNTRYGGAEWSVPLVNPGKVTLCVSGRAQDGTYQTACMSVSADNSLPMGGCLIAVAQTTVTDGCYDPGQTAYTISSSTTGIRAPNTFNPPSPSSTPLAPPVTPLRSASHRLRPVTCYIISAILAFLTITAFSRPTGDWDWASRISESAISLSETYGSFAET